MNANAPRVTIDPPCDQWAGLAERSHATLDERSRRFRAELGLPTDRPIIMTGHQAEWWHCGILAKFLAVDAVCRRIGLAPAWVIPDQDEASFAELRVPVADESGRLRAGMVRLTEPSPPGIASGSRDAFKPRAEWPDAARPALDAVRTGVDSLVASLGEHLGAASAAEQVIGALRELMRPFGVTGAPTVFATRLAGTRVFAEFVDRLKADSRRATELYNRAVTAHPDAGVAPLTIDGARIELPLWRLAPNGLRRRIFASDLSSIDRAELAPRALVLTGLMRWGACDLFVHGTGGAAYDPITEQWLSEWLGASLSPIASATADALLPLPGAEVTPSDAARAAWSAHGARHNPVLAGDDAGQTRKRELLAVIDAAPRRSAEREGAYRALHSMLESRRARNAGRVAELDATAARLAGALAEREVARDRTWAFFLHEPESITRLRERIASQCAEPCGAC